MQFSSGDGVVEAGAANCRGQPRGAGHDRWASCAWGLHGKQRSAHLWPV